MDTFLLLILEEILASTHALKFSQDGKYLAFAKFNSSAVPYYKFTKYGPRSNQYTSVEKIAYPKVCASFLNVCVHSFFVIKNLGRA